ncbi:putative sugar (and other) transporter [Lyophyllum shimeji]|uniref:Sugar (And other) transporter n=1 Tax=Lyophyllum shimeji TaxID=47721 RepID=A0A9P3UUC6_LYOSH|nr:putative sugar (and other) transporter [Lyophyllum shimeji]
MIFLYYSFYDLAFSTPLIVSYTVEILPYALRAKGSRVFNFAISLSLIFNQYINTIALKKLGWKYYLVYVFWLVFETAFVYFFIVEIKNRTLEETAAGVAHLIEPQASLLSVICYITPSGPIPEQGCSRKYPDVQASGTSD